MTLFDNHVHITSHERCSSAFSRGLHVAIDDTSSPPTVRLLHEYFHPSRLQAQSQGSVQPLGAAGDERGRTSNVLHRLGPLPVTHGAHCIWRSRHGRSVLAVAWRVDPNALDNYRAYKMDWVALAWWDPALDVRASREDDLGVYLSWNGATEARWRVVRGGTGDELARSPRTGFETRLVVNGTGLHRLWAEALDSQGALIRSTEVLDLVQGNPSLIADITEAEWTFTEARRSAGFSAGTWGLTCGGILVLVLLTMGGMMLWRRRRSYDRLGYNGSDLDSDTGCGFGVWARSFQQ
jgi:hypothetical protein